MALESADRPSDSPYIERVWRGGEAQDATHLHSIANSNWELVVWELRGKTHVSVRGPETRPTVVALGPNANAEFQSFGIIFSHGASMPHLPVPSLVDKELPCPHTTTRTFVLRGDRWELPNFDNAETFVERLVRSGLLIRDPLVSDVLAGDTVPLVTPRSVQRRVVATTGLTQTTIRQIERARRAAIMLHGGASALDVVHRVGYYDQPHMARSLKRFLGRTTTQLQHLDPCRPLSLLYKTDAEVQP